MKRHCLSLAFTLAVAALFPHAVLAQGDIPPDLHMRVSYRSGGANPGGRFSVHEHFAVFVPTGRAINPVTKAPGARSAGRGRALRLRFVRRLGGGGLVGQLALLLLGREPER